MTDYNSQPKTIIAPDSQEVYSALQSMSSVVLCGRNNSGKSFVLRRLTQQMSKTAFYLGPARYRNFTLLGTPNLNTTRKQQRQNELLTKLNKADENVDVVSEDLAETIAELTDSERELLFDLLGQLLGSKPKIESVFPENSMSRKYVSVDGYNLSFTSSGFRLVAILLTPFFLHTTCTTFLIDEPEIGLSPEIQAKLSDFLLDEEKRAEFFPHIKSIILATHSPIFLDRSNLRNNFFVDRTGLQISIRKITTIQDLNTLQFFLLGNRFETLFLPSAIVFVEGQTDYDYLSHVISLRYPDSLVSVTHCGSDSKIRDSVYIAQQMLTDIRRSPYAERMFVVIDRVHATGLTEHLIKMGISKDNIIVWDSNGIEYVYPTHLLERRFGGKIENLTISGDEVSGNGLTVRKKELADFIVQNLDGTDSLPDELNEKLLKRLDSILH